MIKKYLSMHLKVALEYKVSFILTIIAQSLSMFLEIFAVEALFYKFSLLDVYNINQLILSYSVVWLGFSLAETFSRGFDHFADLIVNGNFDLLLIRPRNIFLQIFGSDICYEKLGRVLLALYLVISSFIKLVGSISILKILLLILMILASFILFTSVFILCAAFCFKTVQGLEIINIFTNGTRTLAQYPMDIYNKVIRIIFTVVIPITFINYYPIQYLNNTTNNLLYLLCPFAILVFLFISIIVFKAGIKHYYSTGS